MLSTSFLRSSTTVYCVTMKQCKSPETAVTPKHNTPKHKHTHTIHPSTHIHTHDTPKQAHTTHANVDFDTLVLTLLESLVLLFERGDAGVDVLVYKVHPRACIITTTMSAQIRQQWFDGAVSPDTERVHIRMHTQRQMRPHDICSRHGSHRTFRRTCHLVDTMCV